MTPAALKQPIVIALDHLLRPEGFRKSGAVFSRQSLDVVHLIEVQASRRNVSGNASFTVNVGVFAPAVAYNDIRDFIKPSIAASHWRERLGSLGAEQQDLWWSAHNETEAAQVAAELVERVRLIALPALAALPSLISLVELWRLGHSPGVPAKLRDDFLQRLCSASARSAA